MDNKKLLLNIWSECLCVKHELYVYTKLFSLIYY